MSEFMNPSQAAKLLGISRSSVLRLIAAGLLPAYRPTKRRVVILVSDIDDYRDACRVASKKPAAAAAAEEKSRRRVATQKLKYLG